MKTYEAFHSTKYNFDPSTFKATFEFSLDDEITFTETLSFPKSEHLYNQAELDKALQSLHIALGVSYFKTCIPKQIAVHTCNLTKAETEFFTTLYQKGLGEFWYKNQIDWQGKINFVSNVKNSSATDSQTSNESRIANSELQTEIRNSKFENPLVPIGGGKDSIVTIETLKKAGLTPTLFRIGSHPLIQKQAEVAGLPLLTVERAIDKQLLTLNEQGALNGHIPITAIVSLVAVVTAILHGHDSVIFSNEHSANEGNTTWHDLDVNHQWSKSLEFENMLRSHLVTSIGSSINYFSLLRPLSEVAITRHFAKLEDYYFITTSSNANWRIWKEKPTELWGTDEKSAFVFALYLTALEDTTVLDIFEQNLFTVPELLDTYRELLGTKDIKPFECVGTPKETIYAFLKCFEDGKMLHTEAMEMFKEEVLPTCDSMNDLEAELFAINTEHNVPAELLPYLEHAAPNFSQ